MSSEFNTSLPPRWKKQLPEISSKMTRKLQTISSIKDSMVEITKSKTKVLVYKVFAKFDRTMLNPQRYANRKYINFAYKKSKTSPGEIGKTDDIQTHLHDLYDGQAGHESIQTRQKLIRSMLAQPSLESQERNELELIQKHRKNLEKVSKLAISGSTPKFVKGIQERIEALKNPNSKLVVSVPSIPPANKPYTSFSIPGGCQKHLVSYEFRRDNASGKNYFVIHNRGAGTDDEEFHGNILFPSLNGSIYGRTSVVIEVSEEALGNETFLTELTEARNEPDMLGAYGIIKKTSIEQLSKGSHCR